MYIEGDDRMEFKRGGGLLILFGLPFLAGGVAALLDEPLGLLKGSQPDVGEVIAELAFGSIFTTIGLAFIFGRASIVIDRSCGEAVKTWGMLVPFSKRRYALSAFDIVTIERRVVRTQKRTRVIYPVALAGADTQLAIAQPGNLNKARQLSEQLGKFLDLGVRDASSGTVIEREAGRLDESIRERVRRMDEQLTWPTRPDGCEIKYERIGDEARLEIPAFGFHPALGVVLLVGVVGAALAVLFIVWPAWRGASHGHALDWVQVVLGLAAAVASIVVLCGFALAVMIGMQRIMVSRYELRVEYHLPLYTHTRRIPADELEELHIKGAPAGTKANVKLGSGIMARSDTTRTAFGCRRAEDARWMHDVVKYVIVGNRPQ